GMRPLSARCRRNTDNCISRRAVVLRNTAQARACRGRIIRAPQGGVMSANDPHRVRVTRRNFIHLTAAAVAGSAFAATSTQGQSDQSNGASVPDSFNEATIAQLQAAMSSGRTSSAELTAFYLRRIEALDENGPRLNSVIELNPDAMAAAQA